jgi:hypothetical protein
MPANKGDKSKKTGVIPSSKPVVWQKQHENALKELLEHLVSPSIMHVVPRLQSTIYITHGRFVRRIRGGVIPETKWSDARNGIWVKIP